jgi:tetratricopeptide (TPR) repeat protein
MLAVQLVIRLALVLAAQQVTAFDRAEELRALGRLREALLAYQEATLTLSDPAPAYRNAAMIELALGDRDLAHIDYERYLSLRPSAEDAPQVRAVMAELDRISRRVPRASCTAADKLFDDGQVGKAALAYESCLAERPHDATLWRRFARCLMRLGNRAGSLDAYRRYLELAPNAPDALFVRAILRAG